MAGVDRTASASVPVRYHGSFSSSRYLKHRLHTKLTSLQIRSPAAFYYFNSEARFNGRKELVQKDLYCIFHQQSKGQSRKGLMTMGRSGVQKVVTPDFRHEACDSIHFVDMMTWFPRLNPDHPRLTQSLAHRLWFGIALNVFHFESNANKIMLVHQVRSPCPHERTSPLQRTG